METGYRRKPRLQRGLGKAHWREVLAWIGFLPCLFGPGDLTLAQPREASSGEVLRALHEYFEATCGVARTSDGKEETSPLTKLLQLKENRTLVQQLSDVLLRGPNESLRIQTEQDLNKEWEAAARRASAGPRHPSVPGIAKDEYVRTRLNQNTLAQQESAAIALAAIGSTEANQALEQASQTGDAKVKEMVDFARKWSQRRGTLDN